MWEKLGIVRVYTKKQGSRPDFEGPLIMTQRRDGYTVKGACLQIHKSMVVEFKTAFVWGKSTKHGGQRAGLKHLLHDEDVLQIFKKNK